MNEINLIGQFTKEFEYSHTTNGIRFYKSILEIKRKSQVVDYIPIIIPYHSNAISLGKNYVHGELRVFNKRGKSTKYIYPDYIFSINEDYTNSVELEGVIESVSDLRKTPMGIYIRDMMILVGDKFKYLIPLIFWNGLAKREYIKGERIHIQGRLQSRTYIKNNNPRTILEVSVNNII